MIIFLFTPSFAILSIVAISWGVLDAIFWPAVVNGVSILSADDTDGKGLAMGLLESVRRFAEFAMNAIIIAPIAIWSSNAVGIMRGFAIAYALLIIPMMLAVYKFVPDTQIAKEEGKSDSAAALHGLLHVLARPRVWLAGFAALTVYWSYVNLIYTSAPYLTEVFGISTAMAAAFGIFNTGLVGIFAGVALGLVSDYVFRSSTKMIAVSLGRVVVAVSVVLVLPVSNAMIWPTLILLVIVAIATFLAKSVILAPVAELGLPEGISGSAMSVGSSLAFASIFWAYTWNGSILDAHAADPAVGYRQVLIITGVVALVGALCATALAVINSRMAANRVAVPSEV